MPDIDREHYWFERLVMACDPELRGQSRKSERPDFLVEQEDQVVGVELTEFQFPVVRGRWPRREIAALRRNIVQAAQTAFEKQNPRQIAVSVGFTEGFTKRLDEMELSEVISGSLLRVLSSVDGSFMRVEVPWDQLPDGIDSIEATTMPPNCDGYWHDPSSQWATPVSQEDIEAQITRKMTVLRAARGRCDSLWLVIVDDVFTDGEAAQLITPGWKPVSDIPFDRLYWLNPSAPHAVRLY